METVTLSPTFRIVIPKKVREQFGLKAGQKLQVIGYYGHIVLVPIRSPVELKEFVKGIDTRVDRNDEELAASYKRSAREAADPVLDAALADGLEPSTEDDW